MGVMKTPTLCSDGEVTSSNRYLCDYQNFQLKGEGFSSYVVGVDNLRKDSHFNERLIWRFSKSKSVNLQNNIDYIHSHVVDVICSNDFIDPPLLVKIDSTNELNCTLKLADSPCWALEMPDYTHPQLNTTRSAFMNMHMAVEIKPKQLTLAPGTHFPEVPYCMNCLLQTQKWLNGKYENMYDYCPLDIHSRDPDRVSHAVKSLIADAHHNLKLFVNGNRVLDSSHAENVDTLCTLLPQRIFSSDQMVEGMTKLLIGRGNDKKNIVETLSAAQQLDTLGPLGMYPQFCTLPQHVQDMLMEEGDRSYSLLFRKQTDDMNLTSEHKQILAQLRRYTVAATLRDCSIIYSLQFADSRMPYEYEAGGSCMNVDISGSPYRWIATPHLIDLDCKPIRKLKSIVQRLNNISETVALSYGQNYGNFRVACRE